MTDGEVGLLLKRLGGTYFWALAFSIRIGDRSVLIAPFAAVLLARLFDLSAGITGPARRWLHWCGAACGSVVVLGVVQFLPGIEPGAVAMIVAVVGFGGCAAYSAAMGLWSAERGWTAVAQRWAVARQALLAAGLALVVAGAALVAFQEPGPAPDDSSFRPSVVFGRPIGHHWGLAAVAAVLVVVAVAIFGEVAMAKSNRATREAIAEVLRVEQRAERAIG
jgi:hypothetical protein